MNINWRHKEIQITTNMNGEGRWVTFFDYDANEETNGRKFMVRFDQPTQSSLNRIASLTYHQDEIETRVLFKSYCTVTFIEKNPNIRKLAVDQHKIQMDFETVAKLVESWN